MLINFIHDNSEVRKEIESSLLPILENWSRQSLKKEPVIYGIRRYLRGAWLGLHVDHLPTHIISVILQVIHTQGRRTRGGLGGRTPPPRIGWGFIK